MGCHIRQMSGSDREPWAEMRLALWPEDSRRAHSAAIEKMLAGAAAWGFVAEADDGTALGFAEVALRPYANGCESQPVPFLEGIWVREDFRRRGVAARLLAHVERFLLARGFQEIGSDTQIENVPSQAAHRAWGFSETERVVYFRKTIDR